MILLQSLLEELSQLTIESLGKGATYMAAINLQ